MSKLRYILLILCLLPMTTWAQRRYSTSNKREYELAHVNGFSTRDGSGQADMLNGLHASLYTGMHHMIGFSIEGSWSSFVSSMPIAKTTPGGGSAGVHLLYEFQYNGFILQTGIGAAYQQVYTDIADTSIYHYNMTDTWNNIHPTSFTLRHQFVQRRDMARMAYGQIPLYAGHYFFGSRGIGYFLAGVHANYAFWGTTQMAAVGSTSGLYERYIGVWEEMDNHGFRKDVPFAHKGSQLQLKLDIMAHAEIGYEYNTQQAVRNYRIRPGDRLDGRIRFGAFVDFGLLNICPNTNGTLYDLPLSTIYDFPTYQMDHVFATADARSFWMRNLFAGIRITFLFGFTPEERCILCDPWRH